MRIKRRFRERFSTPLAAIGPAGNAIIVWETAVEEIRSQYETPGPTVMLYRHANGRYTKTTRLPKLGILESDAATVDAAGRATILAETSGGRLVDLDVASGGRLGSRHRVGPSRVSFPKFSGNAAGQTVTIWSNGGSSINYVLGDTHGTYGHPQTIAASGMQVYDYVTAIEPNGDAIVVWVTKAPELQNAIYAEALTPGAQPVPIATSETGK